MGSWLANIMEPLGFEIHKVGRKTSLTPEEMARICDVVVISVPIDETMNVIRKLAPLVREDALLMDLTSIKTEPIVAMCKYSQAEVIGLHPLFGPDVSTDKPLRVAVCPGRGERWLDWLYKVLQEAGLDITVLQPQEHDRLMGLIQAVNHFSTIALGLLISRSGLNLDDLKKCSTLTFRERLDRIVAILNQPGELFGSLLMDNPYSVTFLDQYLEAGKELAEIAKRKDRDAFMDLFKKMKDIL